MSARGVSRVSRGRGRGRVSRGTRGTPRGARGRGGAAPSVRKAYPGLSLKDLSPTDIAGRNLVKALEKYPDIADFKNQLRDELLEMPQLRVMNMDLLAGTLFLLHRTNGVVTPAVFSSSLIDEIIPNLEIKEKAQNRPDLIQRQKEGLLRYVRAVLSYREEQEAQRTKEQEELIAQFQQQQQQEPQGENVVMAQTTGYLR